MKNNYYWAQKSFAEYFKPLNKDIRTDCVVIGSGIAGATTAMRLSGLGKKTIVLEANIDGQATRRSTGKATCQHGAIYSKIEKQYGISNAALYYKANKQALCFIQKTISDNNGDCDLEMKSAVLFADSVTADEKLKEEHKIYQRMGVDGIYQKQEDMAFSAVSMLNMKNQFQLNPEKYLNLIIKVGTQNGCRFYCDAMVTKVFNGKQIRLTTNKGWNILCNQLFICSHYPFYENLGLYFTKLVPSRSYLIACKYEGEFPEGMYITAESPVKSYLYDKKNKMLLVGGASHITGKAKDGSYEMLKSIALSTFETSDVKYKWSAQDYVTHDGIPLIGRIRKNIKNIYVATGFGKWGISSGTLAGLLLTELAINKTSEYEKLFAPYRKNQYAQKGYYNFLKGVSTDYFKGKMKKEEQQLPKENDTAAIIRTKDGKYGCYRNESGKLYMVDITCPHMGCELAWNPNEKSWDCPCHGSRFNYDGTLLDTPALLGLNKINKVKNKVKFNIF